MRIDYNEDWLGIVNLAMATIGRSTLTSVADETSDAAQVRAFLPQAVGMCAEVEDWTFLRRTADLAVSTRANPVAAYTYELPLDLATLTRVHVESQTAYRREGNLILTDSPTCRIEYTRLPQEPLKLPITFRTAISYYLAYLLAFPLTGDSSLQSSCYQLFTTMILQAKINDRQDLPKGGDAYWTDNGA